MPQLIGGAVGTGCVYWAFNGRTLRVFELFDGTNFWQQILMSIIITFLTVFLIIITSFAVTQPV